MDAQDALRKSVGDRLSRNDYTDLMANQGPSLGMSAESSRPVHVLPMGP